MKRNVMINPANTILMADLTRLFSEILPKNNPKHIKTANVHAIERENATACNGKTRPRKKGIKHTIAAPAGDKPSTIAQSSLPNY